MTFEATGLTTRAEAQDTFTALLTTPFVSARVAPRHRRDINLTLY